PHDALVRATGAALGRSTTTIVGRVDVGLTSAMTGAVGAVASDGPDGTSPILAAASTMGASLRFGSAMRASAPAPSAMVTTTIRQVAAALSNAGLRGRGRGAGSVVVMVAVVAIVAVVVVVLIVVVVIVVVVIVVVVVLVAVVVVVVVVVPAETIVVFDRERPSGIVDGGRVHHDHVRGQVAGVADVR